MYRINLLPLVTFYCLWMALASAAAGSNSTVAQFGASIFLGGSYDYDINNGRSRCMDMVDSVKQYSVNYVQFVPTFYWVDTGPAKPWPPGFDPSCANSNLTSYYCYDRFNATTVEYWCYNRNGNSCPEVSQSDMSKFQNDFTTCLKYAADKGLNLSVNARVDDGRNLGGWRNTLNFDPTQKYGSYSYEEAILNPIAASIAAAAKSGSEVQFTLQGEMGATVFFHPIAWQTVIQRQRSNITQERSSNGRSGPVLVGLGANNLKACGCQYIGIVNAYEYLGNLSANLDTNGMNLPAIKQTYLDSDFISISAYIPVPNPNFQPCELEGLLQRMDTELKLYNISLAELENGGVSFLWGEYGMGGGASQNGDVPATTAQQAGETPFFGIGSSYSCSKDPFDMCHPNVPNQVREFRRYYYNQTAAYFDKGGCMYHGLEVAYIWGTGSWDVLAIYPGDSNSEGSWSDPVVTATINSHNQAAAAGKPGPQLELSANRGRLFGPPTSE